MKENLTEIIFLLDRSGSMHYLTSDTIGGYNSFIEKQKAEQGEAIVTTVLFDDNYELLHNGRNIKEVHILTPYEYYTRGMTALYDAIGKTINDVGTRLSNTPEEERPSKVIFIITTDGMENASREFNKKKVKEMIEHQTNKYSWDFIFLGANIDSASVAENIGIANSANYTATSVGTDSLYNTISDMATTYRTTGVVDKSLFENLV